MQWGDHMNKRKLYLMAYQPVCDNSRCRSANVEIVDPYDNPAQWKCLDCGLYFPYEPNFDYNPEVEEYEFRGRIRDNT